MLSEQVANYQHRPPPRHIVCLPDCVQLTSHLPPNSESVQHISMPYIPTDNKLYPNCKKTVMNLTENAKYINTNQPQLAHFDKR